MESTEQSRRSPMRVALRNVSRREVSRLVGGTRRDFLRDVAGVTIEAHYFVPRGRVRQRLKKRGKSL